MEGEQGQFAVGTDLPVLCPENRELYCRVLAIKNTAIYAKRDKYQVLAYTKVREQQISINEVFLFFAFMRSIYNVIGG